MVLRVNSLYILDNEFPKNNLEMEKAEFGKSLQVRVQNGQNVVPHYLENCH